MEDGAGIGVNTSADFANYIRSNKIDYMDFGCSKGGSLAMGRKQFGGARGLGIDIAPDKVELTRQAGFDAVCFDIENIPAEKSVRFTVLSHFLEHVPNNLDCDAFVKKACEISTDFVFIQQPYFDADSYLLQQNLKLFWSDWAGHPNRMTSLELMMLLNKLKNQGLDITFSIHARGLLVNSQSDQIHHLLSPPDQHEFDDNLHPPKNNKIEFKYPVYKEIIVLISMPGINHDDILSMVKFDITIVDTDGSVLMKKSSKAKKSKMLKKSKKVIKKISKLFS